ncbi:MAG: TfoX/Sxy family protein, partial [Oscillospiraceae bacterium]|nr:TfoX/Sxy family protein [Oscillospiraceae bacterium]
MASTKEYLDYVLDCLRDCDGISYRGMMGEYILYYNGKVFGGIYDDRFLVKSVPASEELLGDAIPELPYEGGTAMLPVAS